MTSPCNLKSRPLHPKKITYTTFFMETIYLCIIIFLFVLAVFDLIVGVSNDAVNFLNSAVGAKAASFKTILFIAGIGIFIGASLSNGMMDIARHGIYQPEHFYFAEIMCILLAVMLTDVVLLDVFNSMGMPTSTTVSLVFELLGGTFALSLIKVNNDATLAMGDLINTDKALSVIMAIFVSVAIAFFFGMLVQWLARIIFTFNYTKNIKYSIGLFGGIAATSIIYFMLIKGLKDSSFMTPENKQWIQDNTLLLIGSFFVFFTILMQVLHWLKVNVFKVVVLMGTFALALAFAGNDLVNFIGVPLAGYSSFIDYTTNGTGTSPDSFLMTSLLGPAKTPWYFLIGAGTIMVFALCTSKKAHAVIKTSVDLSRQDEGEENFGSTPMARTLVRFSMALANGTSRIMPEGAKQWINSRFRKNEAIIADGAAFDLVRASVNLVLAGLLIANKVLTTDEINQIIAYYNLDRPGQIIKPQLYCNIKKQGITNENHAEFNDQLIDFVGGHNIQLNNIGWEGESGIIDGALYLDGINDFGEVTGLPVVKDYTVVADRARLNNGGPLLSKSADANKDAGAFILELGSSQTYSYYASTSDLLINNNRCMSYQSKYIYNGRNIYVGKGIDSSLMWLGTVRDGDNRFSKLALWSLMLFPYSLSEFLLERQLRKYKAGTLYPDMIEFRPIVKSNIPYSSISYSVNPGVYVTEGSTVTITITLSNASDKLIGVSSNAISDMSVSGGDGTYEITGKVTKSPQKISIVISSYLTMLGNETLISNETLIKNE